MNLGVKQFIVITMSVVLIVMYSLFANYYFHQREVMANVIMSSLRNDLSELSYILSKQIRKAPITSARALLDRQAANNPYIHFIAVFDGNEMLLTTDHAVLVPSNASGAYVAPGESTYEHLIRTEVLEDVLRYYEGNQLKHYRLFFFLEHKHIRSLFVEKKNRFILLFVIIPVFVILLLWLIIRRFLIQPLEKLHRYAEDQSQLPSKIGIRELEYIRSSMVDTFRRLERERSELYKLSRTDALSGLANRDYLQEKVEEIIERHKREQTEFALLFLDLDHFKSINDSLGHDIGDELLKNIARSIHGIIRTNDIVARIGGDEFVIVLTDYADELELIEIIKRIQEHLMQPWYIHGYHVQITSSIGITTYPKDGLDTLTLMKNADIAMYEAKNKGRKGHHFFTRELNDKTQEYIELTNSMRTALNNNEYLLYYQPQNRIADGKIIGAEALIRWNHPVKGIILPGTFIPIAEHNGYILELGKWVLENAIIQKKRWEERGIAIKLSINVAAKQLLQPGFVDELTELLDTYSINKEELFFEITEYVFLHDSKLVNQTFEAIKALGIKLSLDDFGTGYSSLSYLKTFPIDTLKIDKAFMDDYHTEEGSIFIQTIINIAQTLKLDVVCEGIEQEQQMDYLKGLACEFYQGYYCSPPVPVEIFEDLLENTNR